MSNLKAEHPELYNRVRLKAIVFTLLGLSLIYSPPIPTENLRDTVLAQQIGLKFWGVTYLIIGFFITLGTLLSRRNYRLARISLAAAAAYNLMWELALIIAFIADRLTPNPHNLSGPFIVVWGYLTYNLFHIVRDQGWNTLKVIHDFREEQNGH